MAIPIDDELLNQSVLGIDEAGRGPLAGPVVAAGVILDRHNGIGGLSDSKKLSPKARHDLDIEIRRRALWVGVAEIDAKTIDRVNILQATLLAMKQIIVSAIAKANPDIALIDGSHIVPLDFAFNQVAVIKGDSYVDSIMAASIVAKVYRDRLMTDADITYPGYGFALHKGYGTQRHMEAIRNLGPCPAHRMSFSPLRAS